MFSFQNNDKLALISKDFNLSFRELNLRVRDKSKELKTFSKTRIFALVAENSIDFVINLLAAISLKPVALISKQWTPSERQLRLNTLKDYSLLNHEGLLEEKFNPDISIHPLTRLILFTSGSCGHPKAVLLSESNISSNTEAVLESLLFDKAERQHLHLPLSYSFGILGQLIPALSQGLTTYLYNDLMDLIGVFESDKPIGMLSAVPEQWTLLCEIAHKYPESSQSVTHAISAGSRLNLNLRHDMRQAFPNSYLFNNYGMTECSPRVLSLSSCDPEFFSEAVGKPVKRISISFTDDGVMQIQGPQVMISYADSKICEGKLLSGDCGYIKDSYIFLSGRKDDLVKISGERIHCQEVGETLRSYKGVKESHVLAYKDHTYSERLAAFIVLNESKDKKDFLKFMKEKLSGNRRPSKTKFLDFLPLNANGKLNRQALLEMIS